MCAVDILIGHFKRNEWKMASGMAGCFCFFLFLLCICTCTCTYLCSFSFKEKDAFVGYQNDTPASVIFQATHHLKEMSLRGEEERVDEAVSVSLGCASLDEVMEAGEGSPVWREAVREICLYWYAKKLFLLDLQLQQVAASSNLPSRCCVSTEVRHSEPSK